MESLSKSRWGSCFTVNNSMMLLECWLSVQMIMRSMANMNRVMSIFCAVECYPSSNNFNVKPEGLLAVYESLKRWTQPQY